ncbi:MULTISPECIES: response regulator [Acetobacteraceae]|uniref:Two component transcriptional regulator KdpE n=1 Tax=Acidomonas methanolica NBRC 104435 TaxID=1231351 RepID=A0A023D4R1_ACIMT|nr:MULTISPECIES: response regulator transcription factor [Acetobacteraceae]MDF3626022.1 response regulator transcription factor [Brytella acorum]TCS27168.1 two-component system KDP operon response regulator KdpE [Acidomonas methanolica]GAJ29059.1 two component transcriptional regulator KdpE [Acidomonas methanolica NBRC 104435]GBQ49601.1 two component response regulator KdpE [Acidomonas methanolica]GEL00304.1 DNA-binding response regulator [Acidomonas methanolica NBRC 104435]
MSAPRVLVVDDEPAIRRLLRTSLATQDWRVIEAGNGMSALAAVKAEEIDVVLLDLGLPDMDGIEVIRQIRLTLPTLPIVVLSVRDDERGKVAALDLGADDYVTKPFGMAELIARLRAALRHALQKEGTIPLYVSGDLNVDLVRRIVTRSGDEVHLSPREWDILRLLIRHAGRVLTHKHILGQLWGANGDVQQLRVYIRQLRQKLEINPERPQHIITETGVGYRLTLVE